MNRPEFINHLTSNGCVVVREAGQGYTVVRNVINGKMSGVPSTDPPFAPKTLDVPAPERALVSQALIDEIHDQFNRNEYLG